MEPFELLPPVGAKTLMEGIYEMAGRLDPTPSRLVIVDAGGGTIYISEIAQPQHKFSRVVVYKKK